jgi:nucleoside-diphosphate-sugar epimerase
MNSLVIGNTSQLAHYFPEEYEKISSRNIDEDLSLYKYVYKYKYFDRVFITFAEQKRAYLQVYKDLEPYTKINTDLTFELVKFFMKKANAVIVYGSCELWNNCSGEIDLNDKFNYDANSVYGGYCFSKQLLSEYIKQLNAKNVFMLHPFNFNSPYRKDDYLFGKIYDSLINKKKIEIGDTYFYRDLVHPKYVVERSIKCTSDEMVGSGRLTYMNDFIRELYKQCNMNYDEYVTENFNLGTPNKKAIYLKTREAKYTNLLTDTLNDIISYR